VSNTEKIERASGLALSASGQLTTLLVQRRGLTLSRLDRIEAELRMAADEISRIEKTPPAGRS